MEQRLAYFLHLYIPVKLNNRVAAVENPTGSGNHD